VRASIVGEGGGGRRWARAAHPEQLQRGFGAQRKHAGAQRQDQPQQAALWLARVLPAAGTREVAHLD